MEISVLGPLAVVEDGVPVTIRRARCCALLAFLVSRHPERVAAEVLAEALWPDAPDGDRALNSARVHVHHLRRSLPGHDAVLPSGDRGYGLSIPPKALDVARFADHAARARADERRRSGRGARVPRAGTGRMARRGLRGLHRPRRVRARAHEAGGGTLRRDARLRAGPAPRGRRGRGGAGAGAGRRRAPPARGPRGLPHARLLPRRPPERCARPVRPREGDTRRERAASGRGVGEPRGGDRGGARVAVARPAGDRRDGRPAPPTTRHDHRARARAAAARGDLPRRAQRPATARVRLRRRRDRQDVRRRPARRRPPRGRGDRR